MGKIPEVRVSPLVHVFWEETGVDLTKACVKLCWELPLRSIFQKRERDLVAYAITFVDELAIRVPSLNAWDQFIWPPAAAMPWGSHEGGAVWLLPWSGHRPQAHNAGDAVQGDG